MESTEFDFDVKIIDSKNFTHLIDSKLDTIKNLMVKGDVYITTSSMPKHWDGHANMIKIKEI